MTSLEFLPWKDFITLGAALLGAGLGIMNTWNSLSKRRVRLRVTPSHAIVVQDGAHLFSIEVMNLSSFPVTVKEVGFSIGRRNIRKRRRLAVYQPKIIDGGPCPRRLESREAVSACFDPRQIVGADVADIGRAYAMTACDEVRYGDSPALRQLRRKMVKA